MKRAGCLYLFIFVLFLSNSGFAAEKTDPNHSDVGGYGYLISQDSKQTLWWAEGVYKVMKDTLLPGKKANCIKLECAKNEWESFILVSNPLQDLERVNIRLSDMVSKSCKIPASAFTVRDVEYVKVTHPTDSYGFAGEWPDPLPLVKRDVTLKKGENNPFWISIKTPKEIAAGKYEGTLTISGEGWMKEIPLVLDVWDFVLPDTPALRSGFGLNFNDVIAYNNLSTKEEKQKAFDIYMKAFSDYKISPYDPFLMTPIKEKVSGVDWNGGFFDNKVKHSGKYAYMVTDNSYNRNAEASLRELHEIEGNRFYTLKWWAKAKEDQQSFVVGVECYDKNDSLIWFENRYGEFKAGKEWKNYSLSLGLLQNEIKKIMIRLFPSKRTCDGEGLGTVWFDDIALISSSSKELEKGGEAVNLLPCGNFEVDIDKIDIQLDFTDFKKAAKRYFGEYGFNGYSCQLKGLGGGTYYSRTGGVFEGFAQGTEEYELLMKRYLKQMQDNLEEMGILGKEYIYWFDEPGKEDYPFVHETNAMIKKYAPKMTTFLTEHIAGQDISDVTDISCTIWHQLNHEKIEKMRERGLEYWSYLCCAPKSPWISEFIDHDAVNMRMWVWGSYVHHLSGILVWSVNYWNSKEATPAGKFQNPWEEAMSWVTGYGTIQGAQGMWGNGDGRFFYPENRDVNKDKRVYNSEAIPSVRLEILRDGIEDYEYLVMLENLAKNTSKAKAAKSMKLLQIPAYIYKNESDYNKDPQEILKYRRQLAKAILSFK